MKNIYSFLVLILCSISGISQGTKEASITIKADKSDVTISRHIYGHFSEHLGRCIYGGIWGGDDAKTPVVDGYRKDVLDALKDLSIPNLRWPGGCFADEYHWEDGIGPKSDRPEMVNTHWGGVTEDNSFGTHEFLNYCELLGTEPYICGNVGSGTVEEMADWVEYINFDGKSPMADLRRQNGDDDAWGVKYWGVGNENWGCGGNMTAEFYADQYRRYATYARNYGDNKLYKVAGGANSWDVNWTEVLMKKIPLNLMDGISLHYYTVPGTWQHKGSATDFDEKEYFTTLHKTSHMDSLINSHVAVMDKYDPNKKIALIVDEYGIWYDVEPGTNPGFLYQQNTLRDALSAGITLNIFNNHADRVKMANLAQTVNVLQAVILTNETDMILTPTYHAFNLYKVHFDAALLNYDLTGPQYEVEGEKMDALWVSCSKDDQGVVNMTIVNIDPENAIDLNCVVEGLKAKNVSGKMITSDKINDYNTFEKKDVVDISEFTDFKVKGGNVEAKLPSKSVVLLQIK